MIEVCNCGEGHRTRLRESTCVCWVPLASVYKGGGRGGRPRGKGAAKGESPTPTRSRTPPFLVQQGKEGEDKKEGGGRPPSPKPIRFGPRGAHPTAPCYPLSPPRPTKAH